MEDKRGNVLKEGTIVKNDNGRFFKVIYDPHFEYAIFDVEWETIEKLTPDVSSRLELVW